MSAPDVSLQMAQISLRLMALSEDNTGYTSLFTAAALRGDAKAMDETRQRLHMILDELLDLRGLSSSLVTGQFRPDAK